MTPSESIRAVLSAWNTPDPSERAAVIQRAVSDAFYYADPHQPQPLTTPDAFLTFLSVFRERVHGVNVRLDGVPEIHHTHARFRFVMGRGESVFSRGTYFVEFAADNRIARMVGFMDE